MMTEDSAPVLFPSVNYSYKGLYIYAMGGYAINGKYAEVDLGISYTWNGLNIGINDYYYPTIDSNEDKYLGGGKHTGHWLEAAITYTPENIPFWATVSNFFYGADKYLDADGNEKQAYSTYLELGTYYDFLDNNRVSLAVGAALNKSCYNGYAHDFSVCNLEFKYTYNIVFNSGWSLPLNVAYIYNPVFPWRSSRRKQDIISILSVTIPRHSISMEACRVSEAMKRLTGVSRPCPTAPCSTTGMPSSMAVRLPCKLIFISLIRSP